MSFRPVTPQNSMGQNLGQLNDMVRQLNKEQQVKTFKQAGGENAIVQGKVSQISDGSRPAYGTLFYDGDGVPSIFLGTLPTGLSVLAIAKSGENVITALGY